MSTCFWAIKDNEVHTPMYATVLENIENSKFDITIEDVEGRHRLKIKNEEFWKELNAKRKEFFEAMYTHFDEEFTVEEFLKKESYYWIDGSDTPDGEKVFGMTRYAGNPSEFADAVMIEVFGCEEVVCEHDELERLVEVGVYDPAVLEDDEDDEEEIAVSG
jgi:hypothetical protein